MSDSHLSSAAPGTGFRHWLGWLFLGVALVVVGGVAVIIDRLWERADEGYHVQTELAFLQADAYELDALEWETIHKKKVNEESSEHMEKIQTRMHGHFSRLGLLASSLPQLEEFNKSYRSYVLLVDQEFKLLAAAKFKEAEEFDVAKVDPAFDGLKTALEETGNALEKMAVRSLGLVRAGTLLVLLSGVGLIGALVWQFNKKRRVVEVAPAERRLRDQHALILNSLAR